MAKTLAPADLAFIDQAARVLEHPSFLMRISAYLGKPIEAATDRLPAKAKQMISNSVEKALRGSLRVAVSTLAQKSPELGDKQEAGETNHQVTIVKKWAHTAAAMSLGAVSGAAGGWALALELPVTTTVMMRSMAAMAQATGFQPNDPEIALEILAVFAYGSPRTHTPAGGPGSESSFFADRAALKMLIKESAGFIAGKTVRQVLRSLDLGAAPKLLELLAILATRMNLVVGEKVIAQSMPVIGAAGGAMLNGLFNDYYSNVAYYVFGLRRLEGIYGSDAMQVAYETAAKRLAAV